MTIRKSPALLCGLVLVGLSVPASAEVEGEVRFTSDAKPVSASAEASVSCYHSGTSVPVLVRIEDEAGNAVEGAKVSSCLNESMPPGKREEYAASFREEPRTDSRGIVLLDWEGIRGGRDASSPKKLVGTLTVVADGHPLQAVDLAERFPEALEADSKWTPRVVVKLRKISANEQAAAFLAALSPELQQRAAHPLDPTSRVEVSEAGVALEDLDAVRLKLALDLVGSSLGRKGKDRLLAAIGLVEPMPDNRTGTPLAKVGPHRLSVSGKPGDAAAWGWHLEGGNLALGVKYAGGDCIREPMFMAVAGTSPEGQKARLLANVLAETGTPASFTSRTPRELLSGPDRQSHRLEPVGISVSQMTEAQKLILRNLIHAYVDRLQTNAAESEWAKIQAVGFDGIRFGWAGGLTAGEDFYYRIQGPAFLIEAAGGPGIADDILTVWTDSQGGANRDLLAEHCKGHD